ncbi:MAG TPA: amino acid permease [Lentisphaeria bacterium]|nr:MAG: amino acid permease [Lentisphaerae bacterium GWF2_38_69]HBM15009.1 amino acid permease [Lentisphaeria bacterium]
MGLLRKRNLDSIQKDGINANDLKRTLQWYDLIVLGVGVIVGTGIFVLTGIGAAKYAGPGMVLSFIFAGITCTFVALAYAELTSMLSVTGSVYTYTYAIFGEILAWIVGWALILEYSLAAAVVSAGWSGYVTLTLKEFGINVPVVFSTPLFSGGMMDLPGALIIAFITVLLVLGTKESVNVSRFLVAIKLLAVFVFLFLATPRINPANWDPFLPFGINGIFTGASFAFLSYLGFDMLSNAAEETINPQKNLPIGIIGSLIVVTILYVIVSAVMTGVVKYTELDTPAPVSLVLDKIGYHFGAALVGTAIIFGLTTVILVSLYAQSRLFLAMSRDGLIPKGLCKLHPRFKTPYKLTIGSAIIIIIAESLMPVSLVAELINIGTLFAFLLASAGIFALRINRPDLERPFKCPFPFIIMPLAVIFCAYLMYNLSSITWRFFLIWTIIGILIYLLYGYWNSRLHRAAKLGEIKHIVQRIRARENQ